MGVFSNLYEILIYIQFILNYQKNKYLVLTNKNKEYNKLFNHKIIKIKLLIKTSKMIKLEENKWVYNF